MPNSQLMEMLLGKMSTAELYTLEARQRLVTGPKSHAPEYVRAAIEELTEVHRILIETDL